MDIDTTGGQGGLPDYATSKGESQTGMDDKMETQIKLKITWTPQIHITQFVFSQSLYRYFLWALMKIQF